MVSAFVSIDDLGTQLIEHAPQLHDVSIEELRSHMSHPTVRRAGAWDMVIGGLQGSLHKHISETFSLYKMHPQRILFQLENRHNRRLRENLGSEYLSEIMRTEISDVIDNINLRESIDRLTITLNRSAFHDPPGDLDCLKLSMSLGFDQGPQGKRELVHELRVFGGISDRYSRENPHSRPFFLMTYRNDAERVLRKTDLQYSTIDVGLDQIPIRHWVKADMISQENIKSRRRSAGDCVMCGKSLGRFERLLRNTRHKKCDEFLG